MNYQEFSQKTRSSKVILARIQSFVKAKIFDGLSRVEKFNVVNVKINGANSPFTFDPATMLLTLSESPINKEVFVYYEHTFSNLGVNTSIGGEYKTHFDSRLRSIGELNLELDFENTGIALETNSSLVLENGDGYFDSFFDKHIWENQKCEFYSWSKDIPESEAKLIYSGLVKDKSFNEQTVTFTLTDNLFRLREKINLPKFTEEFTVSSKLGKEKSLIFGKVDKFQTTSIDAVNEMRQVLGAEIFVSPDQNLLTGTYTGVVGSDIINGGLGNLSLEAAKDDDIQLIFKTVEYEFKIDEILSPTSFRVTEPLEIGFANQTLRNISRKSNLVEVGGSLAGVYQLMSQGDTVFIQGEEYTVENFSDIGFTTTESQKSFGSNLPLFFKPEIPCRHFNRIQNIAGHDLFRSEHEVLSVVRADILMLQDFELLNVGDYLYLNNTFVVINMIHDGMVFLNTHLPGVSVGSIVKKAATPRAYVFDYELRFLRDFTEVGSNIILSPLAEFNNTSPRAADVKLNFQVASIARDPDSTIDLSSIFKPRDFIKPQREGLDRYYEILSVTETEIQIRELYEGPIGLQRVVYKSPNYIDDSTLIRVDSYGLKTDKWIKTPADAVQYLVQDIGLSNVFDTESFNFPLSLYYPRSGIPSIRDVITDINNSCFGSLYQDNEFKFQYKILDADRPENLEVLGDDDIISFSQTTKNNIVSKVVLSYAPFIDETGSEQFKTIEVINQETINGSGNMNTLTVTSYVYDDSVAENIANRWLFYRGQNQSIVKISAKLNLVLKSLNDVIGIKLRRLYNRFGSNDRIKVGIINAVSKDGLSTEIQFNDIGNVFNRVPGIAPNTLEDYESSNEVDLALYGYIVDNLNETPNNSEDELGSNLIG